MSNDDLMLDVSQAHELKMAFRRNGWSNADIKTLSEGDILTDVLKFIKGQAEIKQLVHLIDTDKIPFIPDSSSVEEHKKGGVLKFNPTQRSLYCSEEQKKGCPISGHDLRKELADKPVMNANVLDYLLVHPELIPEEWKRENILFWGTIYKFSNDKLYVRYLYWVGSGCYYGRYWLDSISFSANPAAIV